MRIARLSLDFFGHFAGKVIEFGPVAGPCDFHVIHGPNEAGKTTVMEGYLRLLYGFPLRDPYAFRHQRQNLKVSALLEIADETRPFTRLPLRSGTLRGAEGAILPETALAAHLGGLQQEDYRRLFCLDDHTIEAGGQEIAEAKGDVGRLLFSAAAGMAELSRVLDAARADTEAFHRKRASKTRLAALKRDLAAVDRHIRERDVDVGALRALHRACEAAARAEAEARANRDRLRADQARVAAQRRALPMLAERDRLSAAIADCADYPAHLDIDPEGLVALLSERDRAAAEWQRLAEGIATAVLEQAALTPDPARLGLADTLAALEPMRGRVAAAAPDLPRRAETLEEVRAAMTRIARDLGADPALDPADLVLPAASLDVLAERRDSLRDAERAAAEATAERQAQQARLAEAQAALKALQEAAPAAAGIGALLDRLDADALAPAVASATEAIAAADTALAEALDQLALGPRRFAALPCIPLDPATAADWAAEADALEARILRETDMLFALEEQIAARTAERDAIAATLALADDARAQAARAERDALWQTHRATLDAETADRFAAAMARLDAIEAARLAEAATLGALREHDTTLAGLAARAATIRDRLDRLQAAKAAIDRRAADAAAAIGLPALSPAALSDWMARHERARRAAAARDAARARHRDTLDQAEAMTRALAPMLPQAATGFGPALAKARFLARAEQAHRDACRIAAEKLASLEADCDRQDRRHAAKQAALHAARRAWRDAVAAAIGDRLPADRVAAGLGALGELRTLDARRAQTARQVAAMRADARRFAESVLPLAAEFGIDAADPMAAYRALAKLADQARTEAARHAALGARIAEDTERQRLLAARLADIDRQVALMGSVFPDRIETDTIEALRAAVGTALAVIEKRRRIAALDGQIADAVSVPDIAAARALLQDATEAGLAAEAAALESDLARAEDRLTEAVAARAKAEGALAAVTDDAAVAESLERRATLCLQIEAEARAYLELRFGLIQAEEAIRRYRDRHRSAMMAATERAFRALTNGAYRRLVTKPAGEGEILLAVDAADTPKEVAALSKGTRFQLYLALRAAAYEQIAQQGVRLPFFCDDVFETFDEDRTRAACRLMGQIGRSGQAIYLTHHVHVVEIAQAVCDPPPVVHRL